MVAGGKPEVNLEIFGGFFRIPTENLIYNITVIGGQDPQPVRVVERIVEKEKKMEAPLTSASSTSTAVDTVCQEISGKVVRELVSIATALGALYDTALEMNAARPTPPPRIDPENLSNLEMQAADLAENLSRLRDSLDAGSGTNAVTEKPKASTNAEVTQVRNKLKRAKEIVLLLKEKREPPTTSSAPSEPVVEKKTLYLFDLDVIFQTLYELCTNETVKSHISSARQRAGSIFEEKKVQESLTTRVKGIPPDDGFLNVPISDVTQAMLDGCLEKPIQNLLKKMESNQSSIFLDTILPLPEPEKKESEVKSAIQEIDFVQIQMTETDSLVAELAEILEEGLESLNFLEKKAATPTSGVDMALVANVKTAVDTTALNATLDRALKLVDSLHELAIQAAIGVTAEVGGNGSTWTEKNKAELMNLCGQLLAMALALTAVEKHCVGGEDAGGIMNAARRRTTKLINQQQSGGTAGVRKAIESLGLPG